MSSPERGKKTTAKAKSKVRFPYIALLLLLATIFLFWIYPLQKSRPPVRVSFEPAQPNIK